MFKAVGGFDEDYFMYVEDADSPRRCAPGAKRIWCPSIRPSMHGTARRTAVWKPFLWQLRSLLRYFSKWGFAW